METWRLKNENAPCKKIPRQSDLDQERRTYPVATVHNAGVVKHKGRYIMLFRSHRYNGRSIIGRADSEDGFNFTVHPEPFLEPAKEGPFALYEEFGVEDMHYLPPGGEYLLTYSAYSRHGVKWPGQNKGFWAGQTHCPYYCRGLSQYRHLPGTFRRTFCTAGKTAFGDFALVCLDLLFPGSDPLGKCPPADETFALPLG